MKMCILTILLMGGLVQASWIRYNAAGYLPEAQKHILVLSATDLAGQQWALKLGSSVIKQGSFTSSIEGAGEHTPSAYNHAIDLSSVATEGEFTLEASGATPVSIRIAKDPYSYLAQQALQHIRVERSGSEGLLLHAASHMGDSAAPVMVPDNIDNGSWKLASPARKVNGLGGHYDAGDYLKFTLNEAYLAYHLLRAYQLRPLLFIKSKSQTDLPDILDEANYALQFLMRTFPDENTFVIQLGDSKDHNQGDRLPENDQLNGKRPALCALSRVHMGVTAAALALGSQVIADLGKTVEAESYKQKAIAIYARARSTSSIKTAFLRDPTNDFYWVTDDAPSMQLGAAELYNLTQDPSYLTIAKSYQASADCGEVGWGCWNFAANQALAPSDAAALDRVNQEAGNYNNNAGTNLWGLPGSAYYWAVLHRWIGMANAAKIANLDGTFQSTLDYVLGRNPWGVSFLFSQSLPNTLNNLYSQIYPLAKAFPSGALSEGPGDKPTHDDMSQYFTAVPNDPLAQFNTSAAVFSDNGKDFMLQEATIGGQAEIVLMLALASNPQQIGTSTRFPRQSNKFQSSDLRALQNPRIVDANGRMVKPQDPSEKSILHWAGTDTQTSLLYIMNRP